MCSIKIQILCAQSLWGSALEGSDLASHSSVIWVSNSALGLVPLAFCHLQEGGGLPPLSTRSTTTSRSLCSWQDTGGWEQGGQKNHTAGQHRKRKPLPCLFTPATTRGPKRGPRPTTKLAPSRQLSLHTFLITTEWIFQSSLPRNTESRR